MPKTDILTANNYTLSDIFTRKNQQWLVLPAYLFFAAPLVHVLVFSFLRHEACSQEEITKYLSLGEFPGDYFLSIINLSFVFALLSFSVGFMSFLSAKRNRLVTYPRKDCIPFAFFFVFLVLMVTTSVIGGIRPKEFFGLTYYGEGLIHYIAYFLVFYLSSSLLVNEKTRENVVYAFLAVGFSLGLLSLYCEFIEPLAIFGYSAGENIFYNINFYAYFLTMQIMLSASLLILERKRGRRFFLAVVYLMNSFILAFNNTFGCFVACIVAFIFLFVGLSMKNKKISVASIVLFAVFIVVNLVASFFYESFFTQLLGLFTDLKMIISNDDNAYQAGTLRWQLWTKCIELIKLHPIKGFGYQGMFIALNDQAGNPRVHNEYLEYASNFGVPAALVYISGIIAVYVKALKNRQKLSNTAICCLVAAFGYIGSAFFGNTEIYTAPFFFILLGLANSTSSTANEAVEAEIENSLVGDAAEGKETEPDAIPENEEELSETAVRN